MDTIPTLRAAGVRQTSDAESAAACLQPDHDRTLQATGFKGTNFVATQENDPKYQFKKSYQRQPGLRFVHPGLASAQPADTQIAHGLVSDKGARAGDCFYQTPESELQAFMLEQKESIYRSRRREPLGAGFVRGLQLPAHMKEEEFRFGVTSDQSENAKNLIYQPHPQSPTGKAGSSTAGQGPNVDFRTTMANAPLDELNRVTKRVQREYNWEKAKIDPTQHRFGKPSPLIDYTGKNVADALKQTHAEQTFIVNEHLVQARQFDHDPLGKSKPARGAVAQHEEQHTADPKVPVVSYGRQSEYNSWGARDCIRGNYPAEAQQPDKDLGRSIRKFDKHENVPADHQTRTFGLPSIRTDRHAPKHKSVANDMNYGDESNGKGLLYPAPFASEGVNEEDLLKARNVNEIRDVFRAIGEEFSDDEFARLCDLAAELYGGVVSIDSVRHAMNRKRLEQQRLGQKAR